MGSASRSRSTRRGFRGGRRSPVPPASQSPRRFCCSARLSGTSRDASSPARCSGASFSLPTRPPHSRGRPSSTPSSRHRVPRSCAPMAHRARLRGEPCRLVTADPSDRARRSADGEDHGRPDRLPIAGRPHARVPALGTPRTTSAALGPVRLLRRSVAVVAPCGQPVDRDRSRVLGATSHRGRVDHRHPPRHCHLHHRLPLARHRPPDQRERGGDAGGHRAARRHVRGRAPSRTHDARARRRCRDGPPRALDGARGGTGTCLPLAASVARRADVRRAPRADAALRAVALRFGNVSWSRGAHHACGAGHRHAPPPGLGRHLRAGWGCLHASLRARPRRTPRLRSEERARAGAGGQGGSALRAREGDRSLRACSPRDARCRGRAPGAARRPAARLFLPRRQALGRHLHDFGPHPPRRARRALLRGDRPARRRRGDTPGSSTSGTTRASRRGSSRRTCSRR